jgi:hypothetical protein
MHNRLLFIFYCILTTCVANAQVRVLNAVKTNQPVKIDGKLDDAPWKTASIATDFNKNFPDFGAPASLKSEVRICYDNTAIYVGAYLYGEKKTIRRQLTQRDQLERQDVDVFTVGLDTYHDRQNGFLFQVSAAGVQGDARQSQTGFDRTWDAVWESSTSINADGWVVEIKIPFSAIRFAKKSLQDWGLQFTRFSRTNNEEASWCAQDPNMDGSINQWGLFKGLQNIVPPLRLSFLPYLSGGVRSSPTNSGWVKETPKSGGMDVKYGVNESFTLDMTLIPDFAQVQSDNVVLNLTPFQLRFEDFRPFFTEGTELFNKANLFYSRRIGASPTGSQGVLDLVTNKPEYRIQENPGITRLYNATKFSGRTKGNLGIGVLNTVSAPMYARLVNTTTGKDTSILTEPFTNYNILVLDQALKNRSSISFTNTNVLRRGNSRNANVSSLDISLFDKKNIHNFSLYGRFSSIWGKSGAYNGFTSEAAYRKVSGPLQYELKTLVISDKYDPNDLGFLLNNNIFEQSGFIGYFVNNPTKRFIRQRYSFSATNRYLYKPFSWSELQLNYDQTHVFKNFWDVSVNIEVNPLYFRDFFEARTPGVVLKRIPYVFIGTGGSTDSRKKLYVSWYGGFAESPYPNDFFMTMSSGVRYRFNDRMQVSIDFKRQKDNGAWGFSHRDTISTMVPGFKDPIISFRKVRINEVIATMQYSFTPRMNWTIRMRHNWTYVDHLRYYKLRSNGDWYDIPFAPDRNWNFNVFNVDMFYTWDFKWGSRVTLAWKNALGGNVFLDPYQNRTYRKNVAGVFNNPHSNELTLKIVYFLDYLNLKRH